MPPGSADVPVLPAGYAPGSADVPVGWNTNDGGASGKSADGDVGVPRALIRLPPPPPETHSHPGLPSVRLVMKFYFHFCRAHTTQPIPTGLHNTATVAREFAPNIPTGKPGTVTVIFSAHSRIAFSNALVREILFHNPVTLPPRFCSFRLINIKTRQSGVSGLFPSGIWTQARQHWVRRTHPVRDDRD